MYAIVSDLCLLQAVIPLNAAIHIHCIHACHMPGYTGKSWSIGW